MLGSKDSDPCQVSAPAERGACPNSMHVAASLLSAQAALLLSLQADGPRRGEGARGCLRPPRPRGRAVPRGSGWRPVCPPPTWHLAGALELSVGKGALE